MKDPRLYIVHIRECIDRIEQYTANGKNDFYTDLKTQDAVIRNLETLGDATQQLPTDWKATRLEINWREVANFRNVLSHQYLEINLNIVWNIIENKLPELKQAIEAIAQEFWNT